LALKARSGRDLVDGLTLGEHLPNLMFALGQVAERAWVKLS
jgi:hypothetical protein